MNLNILILLNYNLLIIILTMSYYFLNFNQVYKLKLILVKYTQSTQFFLNLITIILCARFLSFHNINCEGLTFSQEPLKSMPRDIEEEKTLVQQINEYIAHKFFVSNFEYPYESESFNSTTFHVYNHLQNLVAQISQKCLTNNIPENDLITLVVETLNEDPCRDKWVMNIETQKNMIFLCKQYYLCLKETNGQPSLTSKIMAHIAICINLINYSHITQTDINFLINDQSLYFSLLMKFIGMEDTKYFTFLNLFQKPEIPSSTSYLTCEILKPTSILYDRIENLIQKIQDSTNSYVSTNQEIKLKTISILLDDDLFTKRIITNNDACAHLITVCKQKFNKILEIEGYVTPKGKIIAHLTTCIQVINNAEDPFIAINNSDNYLRYLKDIVGPHNLPQFSDSEFSKVSMGDSPKEENNGESSTPANEKGWKYDPKFYENINKDLEKLEEQSKSRKGLTEMYLEYVLEKNTKRDNHG